MPPDARYSTLQDIDAGRHTEIDMFSGALMRMARAGIPTPYNEYTYHMIKALEEKNDGLLITPVKIRNPPGQNNPKAAHPPLSRIHQREEEECGVEKIIFTAGILLLPAVCTTVGAAGGPFCFGARRSPAPSG